MKQRGKPAPKPDESGAAPAVKRRKRRRGGRGALWVIAIMLAASGLLRLGGETGRAIAKGVEAFGSDSGGEVQACQTEDDIAAVLALLQEREAEVSAREAALADRMQALAVAETQVNQNMAALQEAEASLKATMSFASSAAEEDIARLTTVYENMKAKDAAPVFAEMDPQFAAGFLARMRPDAAAAIMAGLDPQKAYSISVLLAGRNANVPTE